MHAIRLHAFGPAENLTHEEVEDPRPGPGQVRVAVRAAGVHLLDTALREGMRGPGPAPAALPTVPGREVAGVVDALGEGAPEDLLGRRAQANLAANLDRQELGEQFRMVDPAVTPSRPFSPNRPALTMMSVTVGAGLGLVLVILLEYRDRTFRTDDDLTRLLELPVLAVVPFMQTDDEKRRAFWRQMAVHAGCSATVAVCGAVVLLYLR